MKYFISISLILFFVWVYFSINPATSQIMPKCPFHLLTGLDCPACGNQRALHHFLHGDWITAIKYNYFLAISVPYFLAVVVTTYGNKKYILLVRHWVQHPIVVGIFLVLSILWWVLRNIPAVKLYFDML